MPSPLSRLINQFARMNLRNLKPMQVNQTKKRKRSPPARRSAKTLRKGSS